ncbi:hypothetical protein ACFV2H_39015 [Streptomyces sp. NPDC059629]|uniref:hypothetical protein n=1 Tax=Streptomyces sp. NPDC059629 TaxID=3346889 RepID=UPI0036ADF0FF
MSRSRSSSQERSASLPDTPALAHLADQACLTPRPRPVGLPAPPAPIGWSFA